MKPGPEGCMIGVSIKFDELVASLLGTRRAPWRKRHWANGREGTNRTTGSKGKSFFNEQLKVRIAKDSGSE